LRLRSLTLALDVDDRRRGSNLSPQQDMMPRRLATRRWALLALAAAPGAVAGCRDVLLGGGGPPYVEVALTGDVLRVGDSAAVVATVFGPQDRVVSNPSVRLSVSDTTVANLRGTWLVGRHAGRAVVRAESGGRVGEVRVVVE
jgi:hypothetical protein